MEIEEDNTIPSLDTTVTRDGLLTNTVYRKPTHTDQFLDYDSHHPQSVKSVGYRRIIIISHRSDIVSAPGTI